MVTQDGAICYHPFPPVESSANSPIVVGFDGSRDGERAAEWAAAAALLHAGTRLRLVQALALPPLPHHAWDRTAQEILEGAETEAREALEALSSRLRGRGVIVDTELRRWLPAETLIEACQSHRAALLVVGQHGHRRPLLLLGSTSDAVSRLAECPVVVVRGAERAAPPRRILLALDGSPASGRVAVAAGRWFPDATLVAASFRSGDEGLDEPALRALLATLPLAAERFEPRCGTGDPAAGLLGLAAGAEIDLVAAGRRGHGLLRELLLGSVSEKLLQLAPCPLLLAH